MSDTANAALTQTPARRIEVLDLARGLALLAMASYHFSWDLEQFGYLDPGTATQGLFKLYARSIAGSFLFLAGVSLMLAHGGGIRPRAFLKRLGIVAGAAALITIVTIYATPDSFIFFGILHAIAASSVIGLAFLRLPGLVTVLVGIGCIALPYFFRSDIFNTAWLSWIGLATMPPRSNDYVPLMPWLGPFLIGMGCTKIAVAAKLSERLAAIRTGDNLFAKATRFSGRHSLAFYLAHQPLLLALVWAASQLAPPKPMDPLPGFVAECEAGCADGNSAEFCARFCVCVTDELLSQGLFNSLMAGEITPDSDARIPAIAEQCTASSAQDLGPD
ncbi:MAG: membrane protein [Hoeflea sp. BRH_c9]|nr:MAG: membrane protein [Hoeflea sp. BRH_c9]